MKARLRESDGFSLVEMLIALVVLSIIMATSMSFFRGQIQSFRRGSDRFTITQNAAFAVNTLETSLRTAAAHLTDDQPPLVYADSVTVAFNTDFATNDANDVFAVYYERTAPDSAVTSLGASNAIVIPGTAFTYPGKTYRTSGGGANSPAETIIFFFRPDSTSLRTDDYVLFRQTNGLDPELVSRNLLRSSGQPFFQYWEVIIPVAGPAVIDTVLPANLPLSHSVPAHGTPADTGTNARIDRIRAVFIRLRSTNGLQGAEERTETMTRMVWIPNLGIVPRKTCGDVPLLGGTLTTTPVNLPGGEPAIDLSWGVATDESTGEQDVVRYVIWRRPAGAVDWGDPLLSIPSGLASYAYTDTQVDGLATYDYALAAQDCTPSLSALTTVSAVTAPAPIP